MTALGKKGVREIAAANLQKAHYAKTAFKEAGFEVIHDGYSFNEFVVKLNKPVKEMNQELLRKGMIGGYDLGRDYPELANHMLVAVTEQRSNEEIDTFVKEVGDLHA
jgi:glycine dehydrogenase subunit 1